MVACDVTRFLIHSIWQQSVIMEKILCFKGLNPRNMYVNMNFRNFAVFCCLTVLLKFSVCPSMVHSEFAIVTPGAHPSA